MTENKNYLHETDNRDNNIHDHNHNHKPYAGCHDDPGCDCSDHVHSHGSHDHNGCHHDENPCGCGCHSHGHRHAGAHGHEHEHNHTHGPGAFFAPAISFVMLIAGLAMTHFGFSLFGNMWVELVWYLLAFLPVGIPVIREAVENIAARDYFNEFTLMVIACIGAFCIREFPEAVGVMLFYSVGETLQHGAVDRATRNITKLLDVRARHTTVVRDGQSLRVDPKSVAIGEIIEVYPGERVPLDGVMVDGDGIFDTSALTGESMPREISRGEEVLAGMISAQKNVRIHVTREFDKSAISKILDMVRNASSRKAHTELFIRRFARIYTPVVIVLAILVVAVPAIVAAFHPGFHYIFSEWLYRALVFLVISCPCALVISVPLGYYAGIGAASRAGLLFKGGNYLEAIAKVNTVAFDKTGTLTAGSFSMRSVVSPAMDPEVMLALLGAAESGSTHPLAKALVEYVRVQGIELPVIESMQEKSGYGVIAKVDGKTVLAGNIKLLASENIPYPAELREVTDTAIVCAVDNVYAGYVTLEDSLKPDSADAVRRLHELGIGNVVMLSGDRKEIVAEYASRLGINEARGEMLPQDKAEYVQRVAAAPGKSIAFVGDGMNDAPVLALSNVGIAMGGLGSDAAIESADVVIQTDSPSRVATAIHIGRTTHTIVTENIVGAIGIKVAILALGAMGYASLWAAVFADVGVALLAVLNSMRILWKRYR